MKLNPHQKELLRQLGQTNAVPELLKELTADTHLAWQRSETKEKREDYWHLTRAIKKLSAKFDLLFKEADKP